MQTDLWLSNQYLRVETNGTVRTQGVDIFNFDGTTQSVALPNFLTPSTQPTVGHLSPIEQTCLGKRLQTPASHPTAHQSLG
ncbi:hypothetical protein [Nostoc favosum]|uniref:Uncharacterized protein n=1 Tax=Nostoc favosum CHAB5714 TaxID=2780399 RepID=A0ABS8IKS1_9NOSO|nr:hypothetical protein [Nostoc favosum]MCC5604616.1 hypothetical protein [Nostoc favosum CHAB5714]